MEKVKSKLNNALLKVNVALTMAVFSAESFAAAPDPIGANTYSAGLGDSVSSLNTNIGAIPSLLLNGAQIFGIFSAWKAWDVWNKAQKGQDPNASPAKAAGWLVGGVGAYFLPSMLGMGGATLLPS